LKEERFQKNPHLSERVPGIKLDGSFAIPPYKGSQNLRGGRSVTSGRKDAYSGEVPGSRGRLKREF